MTTQHGNTQKKGWKRSPDTTGLRPEESSKSAPKTTWRPYPFTDIKKPKEKENWEKVAEFVKRHTFVTRQDLIKGCGITDGSTLYKAMQKANVHPVAVVKATNNKTINLYGFKTEENLINTAKKCYNES